MMRQGSRAKTEQAEMEEDGDRPSAIADVQARRGVPSPRGVAIEKHATRQRWRLGEENQRLGYIP